MNASRSSHAPEDDPRPCSAPAPLRVVMADDHPLYRAGLGPAASRDGIDVVAEVPNATAAIRAAAERAPDVVVMDLNMPGLAGDEAIRRLGARRRPPASSC